jgi:DNA-binding transcriptional LysR family regulator
MQMMDIRVLEAFRVVMQAGSVTRAAATLGLTQPAVSAQIAKLEGSVGFELFERVGNRLRPTAEGLAFRDEVERMLGSVDELGRAAERIRDGAAGSLVVAGLPLAATTLLPPVIAAFARERPDVHVEVITRNSDVIRGLFPSRTHDIGITELPVDPAGLRTTVYEMNCVAILRADHPLAACSEITPVDLSGLPFIGMSRQWAAHHLLEAIFAEQGAHLRQVAEVEVFAAICALVAEGLGVSIVDPVSASRFAPLGLVARPFRPAVPYKLAVFHSSERPPSRVALAFLGFLDAFLRVHAATVRGERR